MNLLTVLSNPLLTISLIFFGFSGVASAVESKIKFATDATYPPMEFEGKDGKVVGFDIDLAKAFAKKMGQEPEFMVMAWDGILAGLSSGRYDLIISSMNITPDRQKAVDFVQYMTMSQVFVTKVGAPEIKEEKQLAGLNVAVQADTTSHEMVKKALTDKKIPIKDIKAFKGATDAFAALKAGQASVIVIDQPVGLYYTKLDPKTFKISGHATAGEPVGIAIRKNQSDLKKKLEAALSEIKKDGTFRALSIQWFGVEI